MVQKVSSLKDEGLSPSDCDSDPEENEISDDDDDDRNHKHRRRETQSQSMERDLEDQGLIGSNRKRNKPFGNGQSYRENDSQSSETWKRRNAFGIFSRAPNKANQLYSADLGRGRGRGKEFSPWIARDPRFNSVDMASQMVSSVPVPPKLFAGRGLPGISNPQSSSWSAYGLIPGVLNGGLDSLHPLGLQGALRPSISLQQNMGIMRQRCRDFEERGFCLRGDMCPMEHGVNRIVVEDVQSLSQFNLPVSLPSEPPVVSSATLPSITASSSTMMNSSLHSRSGKSGTNDGGLSISVSTVSGSADGSDFYDPDQPLWANDCPGTSTTLPGFNSSKFDETGVFDARIEHQDKSNTTAVVTQGTSSTVWGRVGSKNNSEMKGRFGSSDQNKERKVGSQDNDTSLKTQDATQPSIRKPTQKALRTLFVIGIPNKDNTIEALLSHFKKFGEVIDIYIPHAGDRAFVQFSKREEAECALKAPDAVMGNRFIKLLWANRDRIPEDVPSNANNASLTPRAVAALQAPPHPSVVQKGKDDPSVAPKSSFPKASVSPVPRADNSKLVVPNLSIVPPLQKKPGNLALLEEFRKRQESFAQKRDALQRELAKMEKKAAGSKGEVTSEQVAKRQKVASVADSSKTEAPNSNDSGNKMVSPEAEVVDQKKPVEKTAEQSSTKLCTTVALPESPRLKQSICPLAPPCGPFVENRYKLDNRPTAFRIQPPLPAGLENIDVLKEHFSAHGDLSLVELEDGNSSDSPNCSALVRFTNRLSAENAFVNGKCWQGHLLPLVWAASSNPSNDNGNKEKPLSASGLSTNIDAESGYLGTKNSNEECMEKGEDLRSSSSSASGDS